MSELVDQIERDRFVSTHDRNISVIAPAGVGKTRAIVERIVALAMLPEAVAIDRLARLVVVTYSVRAAQEMQQRARIALRQAPRLSLRVQRAFQQTFFGTIHSFCVRLLDRFGHYLGLPSPVALLRDHREWWNRFLRRGLGEKSSHFAELFHFFPTEKLYGLGQEISPGAVEKPGPIPALDLQPLLDYPLGGLHHSTKKSLIAAQVSLRRWSEAWARGDRFHPLPKCPDIKATDFIALWQQTFAPLHDWLSRTALAFGREIANDYEKFRLSEAVMTYDDQVRLALRLLDLPTVRRELAEEKLSVLLDEAQDTDPRQFEILRRVAGLASQQTADQTFCIVGDFQQAIYTPRSDLAIYQKVHDELIAEPRGAGSRLTVTFRCDEAIIRFANKIFPGILTGTEGQSAFFPLTPRLNAGPGQVARWVCPDEPDHAAGKNIKAAVRASHEARFLASQLQSRTSADLGATAWSQVAILCPRIDWLRQIAQELRDVDLPVQLHSSAETQSDSTARAWLAALISVVAHPEDSFEVAGVLREIFGVSDHAMATYTGGDGERLRLDRPLTNLGGPVEDALQILREAAAGAESQPLHQAVRKMVETTRLRERLRLIEAYEFENTTEDLDDLLASIFRRSADGATLAELAHDLRGELADPAPAEEEIHDAIQLFTSHKAKGLEWQAVIVPYVFRPIETKNFPYPRLVQGDGGTERIVRDKIDYELHAKHFVSERERQQLQRLLYVTCTRARRTLLLIDDETLFDGHRSRGGSSAGQLLDLLGGTNRITWKALPESLTPIESTPIAPRPMKQEQGLEFPSLAQSDLAKAMSRAQDIPARVTPHALAVFRPGESEPERELGREENESPGTPDHPGILYGTWWHDFIQSVPWEQPTEAWRECFTDAVKLSPQPGRAAQEWELFCRSDLARWLAQPGRVIHREAPFLWMEKTTCFEGVMDLAVYTPSEATWDVIDWKTNRDAGPETAEQYRGQIEVYVRALRKMFSTEVRGSLYLTGSGVQVSI